jgi:hypothetical protein
VDSIANSIFLALRAYYAATKSDKEAYAMCKETVSPVLEKVISSLEGGKIVDFMALVGRKAGLLTESMKWNDLGLRKCSGGTKSANALFLLRNAGILFCLSRDEIGRAEWNGADLGEMPEEMVQDRLTFAQNCLHRFAELDVSFSESLRDELDYLRKTLLATTCDKLSSSHLKEARSSLPIHLLSAILHLVDLNPSLLPKLVVPTRALIIDILTSLRSTLSSTPWQETYHLSLDLCQKAAIKLQDNQALQFTGNQFFNCGNTLLKAGHRRQARVLLEKSLELDFSPILERGEGRTEDKGMMTARCRKLETLGECCGRGEEKVLRMKVGLTLGCVCADFRGAEYACWNTESGERFLSFRGGDYA